MKQLKLAILPLLYLSLSACSNSSSSSSDGNRAVDSNGACTQATIDAYNDIFYAAQTLQANQTDASIRNFNNKCVNLKNLVGVQSCKAIDAKSGSEITVSYSKVAASCDKAAEYVNGKLTQTPETTTTTTLPAPEQVPGEELTTPASASDFSKLVSAVSINILPKEIHTKESPAYFIMGQKYDSLAVNLVPDFKKDAICYFSILEQEQQESNWYNKKYSNPELLHSTLEENKVNVYMLALNDNVEDKGFVICYSRNMKLTTQDIANSVGSGRIKFYSKK